MGAGPFNAGDRCFSHYTMKWGTVVGVDIVYDDTTWYNVKWDDGSVDTMNGKQDGKWELARIVPPNIATRYGYGTDPKGV